MRPKPSIERTDDIDFAIEQATDLKNWYQELESHPHVQEVMKIPSDEPIFVLRAQDIHSTDLVNEWLDRNQRFVPPEKFNAAAGRYKEMLEWQNVEPTRAKIPD